MSEYVFRTAEISDLPACHTIECQCFPPCEAAWTTSIMNRIEHFSEGFIVAEQEGKVIGQCNSGCTSKDDITDEKFKQLIGHDPEGENMVIFSLSVLPDHQAKGVGGQLLDKFIVQSRRLNKKRILLLCKEELIDFYTSRGFVDNGVSESDHGNAKWHEMVLDL